ETNVIKIPLLVSTFATLASRRRAHLATCRRRRCTGAGAPARRRLAGLKQEMNLHTPAPLDALLTKRVIKGRDANCVAVVVPEGTFIVVHDQHARQVVALAPDFLESFECSTLAPLWVVARAGLLAAKHKLKLAARKQLP